MQAEVVSDTTNTALSLLPGYMLHAHYFLSQSCSALVLLKYISFLSSLLLYVHSSYVQM